MEYRIRTCLCAAVCTATTAACEFGTVLREHDRERQSAESAATRDASAHVSPADVSPADVSPATTSTFATDAGGPGGVSSFVTSTTTPRVEDENSGALEIRDASAEMLDGSLTAPVLADGGPAMLDVTLDTTDVEGATTSGDATRANAAPTATSSQTQTRSSAATTTSAIATMASNTPSMSDGSTSGYLPFEGGPAAGNSDGACVIPQEAQLEDVSRPDQVVGSGTPGSCTADAFIAAVARGGVITFDCGPDPIVITLERPAKVFNDANPLVTIDGGGLVTLSGGGTTRILYMNTCDQAQVWTTSRCDNQDHPRLTVQNLTFIDGNSENEVEFAGGGAIYASGGRFKVINSRFFNNQCAQDGADVGGAGIRVLQQYDSLPAYVVNSTFGGAPELGNVCSNGGGISSIGVSWTVLNSVFTYNQAVGFGGNPAEPDTPGGGSGGAIYNDGDTMTLRLCGSLLEHNEVNMYGSSIFFVSNDHTGSIYISNTISRNNTGGGWDALWPGISLHEDTFVSVDEASIIE